MNHIQIIITANTEEQEILLTHLLAYDAVGFEQTDNELIAYFEDQNFDLSVIQSSLKGFTFTVNDIAKRNWNEEWEKSFEPVVVEDFCAVRSHFHQPVEGVEHEIIITPKMSFGTGHHATTFLMIQAMRTIDFVEKTVFDFGTGTGILAVLAEKLGAKNVYAIDVDDWSIENATENFIRNRATKIQVALTSNIPAQPFDVILANINKNVLLQYAAPLAQACNTNGYILASGLLVDDKQDLINRWQQYGLKFVSATDRQGWTSLLFHKP